MTARSQPPGRYSSAVSEKEELRARLWYLQSLINSRDASFEQQLAFAYSIITSLLEDHVWLRSIADDRGERIAALEAELVAAQRKIKVLELSGDRDDRHIGRIVLALLTGVAAIATFSGWTLKDLVERPSDPIAPIVSILSPEQCMELGLIGGAAHRDTASAAETPPLGGPIPVAKAEVRGGTENLGPATKSSSVSSLWSTLGPRSVRSEGGIQIANSSDMAWEVTVSTSASPRSDTSRSLEIPVPPRSQTPSEQIVTVDDGKGQLVVRNFSLRSFIVSLTPAG